MAEEDKDAGGIFHSQKLVDVFACISTTIGRMVKRTRQVDSRNQIGLEPVLHAVLIVGW